MKPFSRPSRAFTLVELLVVISIIAILAALALPAFNRARIVAGKAACSANLKQIGAGLFAFAGDNNGMLPTPGGIIYHGQTDPTTGLPSWTEQLEPYMGGVDPQRAAQQGDHYLPSKVYHCPSVGEVNRNSTYYSYFLGSHPSYVETGTYSPVRLSRIAQPAQTIMGGDVLVGNALWDADPDDSKGGYFPAGTPKTHGGFMNILFYDGHVGAYSSYDNTQIFVNYEGTPSTY